MSEAGTADASRAENVGTPAPEKASVDPVVALEQRVNQRIDRLRDVLHKGFSEIQNVSKSETRGPLSVGKPLLQSKTLWGNIILLGATMYAQRRGITFGAEDIALIFGGVNTVLRLLTGKPVDVRRLF